MNRITSHKFVSNPIPNRNNSLIQFLFNPGCDLLPVNRQAGASFSQYAVSSTQEYVDLGIPKLEIGTVTPDQVKEWLEKLKD